MKANNIAGLFYSLYKLIGKDGREAQLFGSPDAERLQQAINVGVLASAHPTLYWEFPLGGKPWLDCLVAHDTKENEMLTSQTDYPFMAAFAKAKGVVNEPICYGLTWDLSQAVEKLEPGFYIDHAFDDKMVETVLRELGAAERWPQVRDFFAKLPASWMRYYLGFFPQRKGTPIRFGIDIAQSEAELYRQQPQKLIKIWRHLGFTAFDETMLKEIFDPVYTPFSWEVQFDLYPDGTLGSDFAAAYCLRTGKNRESLANWHTEPIQKMFRHLEEVGLADRRWKLLEDCIFSKLKYAFVDGKLVKLGFENRLNFLKVKWHKAKAFPAKFYFESYLTEL